MAFWPQVPGHGSVHLFLTHALFEGQSEFKTHSGLQPSYGFPIYSGKQVQEPAPLSSLQIAFAPHGEGVQGVAFSGGGAVIFNIFVVILDIVYMD